MNLKPLTLLVVSVTACVVGFFILQTNIPVSSTGDMLVKFGKALVYGAGALSFILVVLIFIPRAFQIWKKFAIWFVPLAAVLFALYPEPGSGDMFSPYPEQVYRWVSGLFIIVSFGIIAWASRRK